MDIDGKELQVTPAAFSVAMALQKAVMKALKGSGFNVGSSLDDMDAGVLIDAVLSVASDDDVQALLFKCAERALIGSEKIDRDFFEDVGNRRHYWTIIAELDKVNLGPFFEGVVSGFSAIVPLTETGKPRKSR